MVGDLDADDLPHPDQVPRHLDVRLTRSWVPGGVIVLWDAGAYVRWRAERLGTRPVFQA